MYRVLVVEDDAVTSMIVAAALTADGRETSVLARFTVVCKSTLEEALACARVDEFDAILLDLSLPDSCGLESFTRMRAVAPAPAIVIVTALDDDRIAMAAVEQGAQDYLIKGTIEGNVVARSLLYAITRRRAEQESREHAAHVREHRHERARQAQQRESLGRLAAGVAHEFNNLLTVIAGNSDALLAEHAGNPTTSATLREVLRASKRASALTTQLLSFSGRQQFTPTVVDVTDLIGHAQDSLRGAAGREIALVITSDGGAHSVNADPVQLERVLLNLVTNARDALPSGGIISVETSLVAVRDGSAWEPPVAIGEYVAVVVRDNGRGMTPDVRARLFEPFFTTKDESATSGLGLSTVLGVMQQSGGAIRCESSPGGGTTFSLIFPRVVSATIKPMFVADADAHGESGALILVAEDEHALRGLVHRILERHGHRVITVASGAEAMTTLERHPDMRPDLLLTDIVMPGMRGTELAERMSLLWPQLPVLFMSGYADDDTVRRGTLAPNAQFLKKPFTTGELVTAVARSVAKGRRESIVGAGAGAGSW